MSLNDELLDENSVLSTTPIDNKLCLKILKSSDVQILRYRSGERLA